MITRKSPEELSKQLIKVTFALEIAKSALKACVDDRHYAGCYPRHTEILKEIEKIDAGPEPVSDRKVKK